jgi:NADPH:quinone reductase-like Zn-dependent oxidoreductase
VTFATYGDPSVLEVTDVPEPHAGAGEVRIVVRAAALNPYDWKVRAGFMKDIFPTTFPAIPGLEAAGIVDEVGADVEGVSVGDEVYGFGSRTWAEFAVLPHFFGKPAALSWEQAGGLPVIAETALRALEIINPTAGQTLLIDGAAGGVGSAAAQFAIADGVTVIGTASESNHEYLRGLGVVPTTYGPGLADRVAALVPSGVDVALDTAGKGSVKELIDITGSPKNVVTIADFSAAELGVAVTSQTAAYHALPKAAELAEAGKFTVAIDSVFSLSDAAKAHERSEGGHLTGKVILRVS